MKICLCASFMILYFTVVESDRKYNALIFERFKKTLIEMPDEPSEHATCEEWATACPATNDEEKQFNENKSLYGNALFVKSIFSKSMRQTDLKVQACDQPFKLSIAMFEELPHIYFEFGYDIYFQKNVLENFTLSDKRKYTSLKDVLSFSKIAKKVLKIPIEVFKSSGDKPIKQDKEMGFTWIPLFKIKMMYGKLKRIEYDIRKNNRNPMIQCQDYSLGKELLNNIDVDKFYSKEVQEKMFKSVKTPVEFEEKSKTRYMYLEKWQLIPADQYQFGSNEPPTCSNVTTIPIWSIMVKDVLQKVDDYLYTLSRVSGRPLHITAGVNKRLKLQSKSWGSKTVSLTYKLSTLNVSKIIYKIVRFKVTNNCDNEDGCWYGIMIVIHNDPNFDENKRENKICYRDVTEELGWEEITRYNNPATDKGVISKSKLIYVCPIRSDTTKRVGLKYDGKLPVPELSLIKFPYASSENNDGLELVNMKTMLKKMKPTFPPGDESKKSEEKEVIERPLIGT